MSSQTAPVVCTAVPCACWRSAFVSIACIDKGWLYHNTISGTLLLSRYHELYGFEFVSLNKFCLALLVNFFLAVYLDKQTVGYTNGRFHTIRSQIAIFLATYTYVHTYIHTYTNRRDQTHNSAVHAYAQGMHRHNAIH